MKQPNARQRLLGAFQGKPTTKSRLRFVKTIYHLKPRRVVPTGILEVSVGLGRENRWWFVEVYYHIDGEIVVSQRSIRMTQAQVLTSLQIVSLNELYYRPNGETIQRLYKKHDEYDQITEIIKSVHNEEAKDARREDREPGTPPGTPSNSSEPAAG